MEHEETISRDLPCNDELEQMKVDNEIPRKKRIPFGVIVDEFADMASEDFIGFLDRARSSKIGITVAHQEIADLSKVSPEFARRLMNSTSTLFAFLQKLPDDIDAAMVDMAISPASFCGVDQFLQIDTQRPVRPHDPGTPFADVAFDQ